MDSGCSYLLMVMTMAVFDRDLMGEKISLNEYIRDPENEELIKHWHEICNSLEWNDLIVYKDEEKEDNIPHYFGVFSRHFGTRIYILHKDNSQETLLSTFLDDYPHNKIDPPNEDHKRMGFEFESKKIRKFLRGRTGRNYKFRRILKESGFQLQVENTLYKTWPLFKENIFIQTSDHYAATIRTIIPFEVTELIADYGEKGKIMQTKYVMPKHYFEYGRALLEKPAFVKGYRWGYDIDMYWEDTEYLEAELKKYMEEEKEWGI